MIEECEWIFRNYENFDFDDDYYETNCGRAFVMLDGTPKDNGYKFCPSCGKKIIVKEIEK